MALYYFHIVNGSDIIEDELGTECPDNADIRQLAIEGAREVVAEAVKTGTPANLDQMYRVVGPSGKVVCEVPFREAVSVNQRT